MNIRDNDIPDIVFTDINGVSRTVKDVREYVPRVLWFAYNVQSGDEIDEIASRPDVYGEDGEINYYKIIEMNKESFFDVMFDLSKLKTLNIPVP